MNPSTKLEIKAKAFFIDTGMMAPFKDDRSGAYSDEERILEWCRWGKENEAHFQKFVRAFEAVLESEK